jgi:hypothetical protein
MRSILAAHAFHLSTGLPWLGRLPPETVRGRPLFVSPERGLFVNRAFMQLQQRRHERRLPTVAIHAPARSRRPMVLTAPLRCHRASQH